MSMRGCIPKYSSLKIAAIEAFVQQRHGRPRSSCLHVLEELNLQ